MIEFPKDFFWGSATSAYQVEGNNLNCDWWEWEKRSGQSEVSGLACRHYDLYKEDFDLAKELNHNAHRLSIEWSRIEPQENSFSEKEIAHYCDVIISLRARGIEPVVTLHHFTNPLWFAKLGGWENKDATGYFLRYARKLAEALCDKVTYWVTINEPMVYSYHAFILGVWPPQKKSFKAAAQVVDNLAFTHIRAYRLIQDIYKKKNLSRASISIAENLQAFRSCVPTLRNKLASCLRDKYYNFAFIERLLRCNTLDFIGINYYSRSLVETEGWRVKNLLLDICRKNHSRLKKNSLGWDIYPEGLYQLLMKLKRYRLPVFILENGVCTGDDALRWDFIREHLYNIGLAMKKGCKVIGYIYWSLLDNYEWDKGFDPRFGLIEVDYNTYKRSVRESARKLSRVYRTGKLDAAAQY